MYHGYFGNEIFEGKSGREIATAREGNWFNGYTSMRFDNLHEGVEGRDLLIDAVLKELVNHKQALLDGKQVNVYLEWELTQDGMQYTNVKHVKTEYVESEK